MRSYIEFINNIVDGDIVIHISHIDLDGYGASYIVKNLITEGALYQCNTNYGEIISTINDKNITSNMKVLITDLNLTEEEADYLNNITTNWLVVDHHGTGEATSIKYPNNYYLDTTRCGTKLMYNLLSCTKFENKKKHFKDIVKMINTYDLWDKTNEKDFRIGMLLSHYIKNMPFIDNLLIHNYISFLFKTIAKNTIWGDVGTTEIHYQTHFNNFLTSHYGEYPYIQDSTLPTNIKCAYLHEVVIQNYITYNSPDYVIFENISTGITQYVFDRLFEYSEFKDKILINLNSKGHLSFRSVNGKASSLAVKCNGGGHPNAAGGRVEFIEGIPFLTTLIRTLGN